MCVCELRRIEIYNQDTRVHVKFAVALKVNIFLILKIQIFFI